MLNLTAAGTLGRDAELRHTQAGDKVATFSIAIDNGKNKDATWLDCSLWGDRGEKLQPFLTKGTRVAISGRPKAREHNGKIYLGCTIGQLTLLGGGQRNDRPSPHNEAKQDGYQQQPDDLDDEIPF